MSRLVVFATTLRRRHRVCLSPPALGTRARRCSPNPFIIQRCGHACVPHTVALHLTRVCGVCMWCGVCVCVVCVCVCVCVCVRGVSSSLPSHPWAQTQGPHTSQRAARVRRSPVPPLPPPNPHRLLPCATQRIACLPDRPRERGLPLCSAVVARVGAARLPITATATATATAPATTVANPARRQRQLSNADGHEPPATPPTPVQLRAAKPRPWPTPKRHGHLGLAL